MNTLQELMVITMEECSELTQECSKIIRKYDNMERLINTLHHSSSPVTVLGQEAGDVYCMIDMMVERGILDWDTIKANAQSKREKLKRWGSLCDEERG